MTSTRPSLSPTPPPTVDGRISVAYVIDSLGHGGAEHLLVRYLARVPALGVDPAVVVIQERSGNPVRADIERLDVPIVTLGIDRLRQRGAGRIVERAIVQLDPDLVHTQLEFSNILGTRAADALDIPSIATLHTLDRPQPWSRDAVRFRLMAWMLQRRASSVIAVSDSAARHFAELTGADRGLLTTIHNGTDLRAFEEAPVDRVTTRHALGIPEDASLITTVSVLRPPKGIGDMIEALPAVVREVPDVHYLVVGSGPARSALETAAKDAEVSKRVTFTGHRSDIPSLLAASDAFVLPSHTEALPTVLMEAMAAGLPVVATAVGGVPEMASHNQSALLVPPHQPPMLADAVTRVLLSPLQATAMGKAGRRIAFERFDIDRQAKRLVAEYRRVIAVRTSP